MFLTAPFHARFHHYRVDNCLKESFEGHQVAATSPPWSDKVQQLQLQSQFDLTDR